jgi:hypothetical protein
MLFDETCKPNEIIERIYLNIAASIGVHWKIIFYALPATEDKWELYTIANILIAQNLIKYTTLNEAQVYLMVDEKIRRDVMDFNGCKITFE